MCPDEILPNASWTIGTSVDFLTLASWSAFILPRRLSRCSLNCASRCSDPMPRDCEGIPFSLPCPLKELGTALSLDSGTLSPLLKRLEKLDLVHRERRVDDERSVTITLTEQGAALGAKAIGLPAIIGEAMAKPPAELDALRRTLRELTNSVNAFRQRTA